MGLSDLSVTIITLNEEKRIAGAIASVKGLAKEVIVVDSGSTDRTRAIAAELGAHVVEKSWPGYGQQKNFAQSLATGAWVLNIDADERVSPELGQEISDLIGGTSVAHADGYALPRKTYFGQIWVRHGGWYPNYVTRLVRKDKARWSEPRLHESLTVDGRVERVRHPLLHYTFDGAGAQVRANIRYATEGARQMLEDGRRPTLWRLLLKPIGKFIESYFIKRGFLDGLPGLVIAVNAAHSMFLKYVLAREHETSTPRQ